MTFSNRRRFVGTCLLIVGVVLLSLTSVTASGAAEGQAVEVAGSIGDRVWFDDNDNGRIDAEESGVGGVVLELFADPNQDGAPDGPVLQTATSASDGGWQFVGLASGPYAVKLPARNWDVGGPLRGCVSSAPTTVDARDGVDGDNNGFELPAMGIIGGPIVLAAGNLQDDSLDFGCHRPVFDVALDLDAGTPASLEPGDLLEIRVDVRNDGTLSAEALAVSIELSDGLLLADPDWEQLKNGTLLRHLAVDLLRPGITASVVLQVEIAAADARDVRASLASVRSTTEMPNGDGFEPENPADEATTVLTIGAPIEVDEAEESEPDPPEELDPTQPSGADPTLPDTEVEGVSIEADPGGDDEATNSDGDAAPAVDAVPAPAPEVPRQAVAPADVVQPDAGAAPVLALTGAEDRALVLAALMCIVAGAMLLLLEQWMRPTNVRQK